MSLVSGGTNFNKQEDNLLDIALVKEGVSFKTIAYLSSAKQGLTRKEEGFYTFYLKDVKGVIMTCYLFNIKDFIESGLVVKDMLNGLVDVELTVSEYNGSLTGYIDSISVCTETSLIDRFVDTVENLDNWIKSYKNTAEFYKDSDLSVRELTKERIAHLSGGRIGGQFKTFCSVSYIVAAIAEPSQTRICTKVWYTAFSYYVDLYLKCPNPTRLEFLDTFTKCGRNLNMQDFDSEFITYVQDTLGEMLGLSKASTLTGKLINSAFRTLLSAENLINIDKLMVRGSEKKLNERGDTLLKL